ncbi:MAG: AraC family transcriptional regulator [Kofleriaceae bacterium]
MSNDPFSDILRLTEADSVISGAFVAGGRWALAFPPPGKLKFSAIARGGCWLRVDKSSVRLEQGDVVLMPGRSPFVMASDLKVPAKDAYKQLANKRNGLTEIGTGSETAIVSGSVSLHPSCGSLLFDVLPSLVHIRSSSPYAAALRWIVEQIFFERLSTAPGADVAAAQLAQLLFVQLLRAHAASQDAMRAGWMRAISDPKIAPALQLMHGDPKRTWRLEELAKAAGMSRTSFAVHFKEVAGVAPVEYLAEWRMRLAQRMLREDGRAVAEVADALGYTSESAFSTAFKRIVGMPPRNYRVARSDL